VCVFVCVCVCVGVCGYHYTAAVRPVGERDHRNSNDTIIQLLIRLVCLCVYWCVRIAAVRPVTWRVCTCWCVGVCRHHLKDDGRLVCVCVCVLQRRRKSLVVMVRKLTRPLCVCVCVSVCVQTRQSTPLTKEIRLKIFHPITSNSFPVRFMGFLIQIYLISHNIHPKAG